MKNTINVKVVHFAHFSEEITPTLSIHGLRAGSDKKVKINIKFEDACYIAAAIQGQISSRKRTSDKLFAQLNKELRNQGI